MLGAVSTHDFDLKTQDQIVVCVSVRCLQYFNVPFEPVRSRHAS
jgi:hypothetical protein